MKFPNIIFAYHGCTKTISEKILNGDLNDLEISTNDYDWLGPGVYFWENSYSRAFKWAKDLIERKKINDEPAVIGAIIRPGICMDLTDELWLRELKSVYTLYCVFWKSFHPKEALPSNRKAHNADNDILLRNLDCGVIRFYHSWREKGANLPPLNTIRSIFQEGAPIFEGSCIREKNHIQWAVLTPEESIVGYFRPKRNLVDQKTEETIFDLHSI